VYGLAAAFLTKVIIQGHAANVLIFIIPVFHVQEKQVQPCNCHKAKKHKRAGSV
jgi:flavoprotein